MKRNGTISRPNLQRRLSELSEDRFTYVCAPAGYGKTIAVRQWFDQSTRAKTAISLDEYDNIPAHFCRRFCTALQKLQPNNKTLTDLVSHTSFDGAPAEFTLQAVAALNDRKRSILAVDDLHFITNERVLRLLAILLKRLPENVHIVLISRSDLPPVFAELWVKGRLQCITADQLRFSEAEIVSLGQLRGVPITANDAKNICRRTGGWAIGINALLLSGEELSGQSLAYLEQFIRASVWDKWDDATREFMLNTSQARELEPSLCTALTGIADSEKVLNSLIQSGAFLSQSRSGTFQYHRLFHDFLKKMLSEHGEDRIAALINKEGEWRMARQDFYGAADCFLRCGNVDGLGAAIDTLALTNRENFIIERLLPLIQTPAFYQAAQKRPNLFAYLMWISMALGKSDDMESCADQFYARFDEILQTAPARANNIFLINFVDYRVSLQDLLRNAAQLPPMPDPGGSPSSVSMNMPHLHRCARDFSEVAAGDIEPAVAQLRTMIGWVFGDEANLLEQCLKAGLYYEQGHLDNAYTCALAANAGIQEHFMPEVKFCAMSILLCVLDALGQAGDAEQIILQLNTMFERDKAYYLSRNFNAMLTRRKLENGDMQAAREWLAANSALPQDDITFYELYASFTTCRASITVGNYNSAIILLHKIHDLALAYRRPLDIVEARILLAIAFWKKKRGFQKQAIEYLEGAVSVAHSFGYTQLFVNEGAELSGLMTRLLGRAEQAASDIKAPVSFIKMLCFIVPETHNSGLTSGQPKPSVAYTEKQKTVMRLMCEGKSYKEITGILGVKLPTLRSHIALIYKKLDVTSEADAVKKIKESDILEAM